MVHDPIPFLIEFLEVAAVPEIEIEITIAETGNFAINIQNHFKNEIKQSDADAKHAHQNLR